MSNIDNKVYKNHKWIEKHPIEKYGTYRGTCSRCGIERHKDGYGGYVYLDFRTPLHSGARQTFQRPPCNPNMNIQEMGLRCH